MAWKKYRSKIKQLTEFKVYMWQDEPGEPVLEVWEREGDGLEHTDLITKRFIHPVPDAQSQRKDSAGYFHDR